MNNKELIDYLNKIFFSGRTLLTNPFYVNTLYWNDTSFYFSGEGCLVTKMDDHTTSTVLDYKLTVYNQILYKKFNLKQNPLRVEYYHTQNLIVFYAFIDVSQLTVEIVYETVNCIQEILGFSYIYDGHINNIYKTKDLRISELQYIYTKIGMLKLKALTGTSYAFYIGWNDKYSKLYGTNLPFIYTLLFHFTTNLNFYLEKENNKYSIKNDTLQCYGALNSYDEFDDQNFQKKVNEIYLSFQKK